MARQPILNKATLALLIVVLASSSLPAQANESYKQRVTVSNFGLPGIVDLPTARHYRDGELVLTQQLHKSLARSGISFQALPRVGVSFRYTGNGFNGMEAHGRVNHDRGALMRIFPYWMKRNTFPPFPLGFEILLVLGGIRQNIL